MFQESLGGFRKGNVFHERLGGGFGKVWWCQESLGWLQERLRGFREGSVVAGKTGFRGGCAISGTAGWFQGKAVWFPARLCDFTKEDGLGLL